MQWTVLLPVKALPGAKSRLVGACADVAAHERLVLAMRSDTIAAARAARGVGRLALVVDRPVTTATDTATVFVQTVPGLNEGLAEAAAAAALRWPEDGVAVLVADLPALRPADLAGTLECAAEYSRCFVTDAAGTGTTLLTAAPGHHLVPSFGPGSATRHAELARRVEAGAGLRHDVDTVVDLDAARRLGLGPATAAELARTTEPAGRCPG